MTSVVAWERFVGATSEHRLAGDSRADRRRSELVVASDSRLGGGEQWDACAKIFDVGRDDALLAFAGSTDRALPLVLQAIATARSYRGSSLRTLDLPDFAGHLGRVLNAVLAEARGAAAAAAPECEFLLGGWSWVMGRFRIYRYSFSPEKWNFVCSHVRPPPSLKKHHPHLLYATIGDAGRRLTGQLSRAYNTGALSGELDYQPLEQLYQQAIDPEQHSVGGPVQVSKVYKSIRVEHFATSTGTDFAIAGRPVLPTENIDLRSLIRTDSGTWSSPPARTNT